MIARRHVVQSVLSTWAILSMPKTVRAWPSDSCLLLPHASHKAMSIVEGELPFEGTQIKIVGVGDCGCNAVEHMNAHQVPGVEYICVNTNAQALSHCHTHKTIQLGESGLGTGSCPDSGHQAALLAEAQIRAAMKGSHMLFIIAGLGGGTGTGAAPVIARIAKSMGIQSIVGVVIAPFEFEGDEHCRRAEQGLYDLEAQMDSLIVLANEKLMEKMPDVSLGEAADYINDLIKDAVCGIAKTIQQQAHVCVDFEDVRTVMSEPGKTRMATAVASGPDRARHAADQAVTSIQQDNVDLSAAHGVLVLISGVKGSLKLSEAKLAMNMVRRYASSHADVIYGTFHDDSLNEKLRVTVIATGLHFEAGLGAS